MRLTAALAAVAAALLGAPLTAGAAPPEPPRNLPAAGWQLVDESSGDVLAAREAHRAMPIASATKLMTAFITLRMLEPGDVVTAPEYPASPLESLMGLQPGEQVSVRDMLYGLLLASGNDAAYALALRVSGSLPDFVREMNRTAARLGLRDTSYVDPIGLGEGNVSSAGDLNRLATRLRQDPLFRRIVDTPRITLRLADGPTRIVNRNTLVLDYPFVNGIKTGTTVAAGWVLVASARRRGVGLVSAVLGAPGEQARDRATLKLLRFGGSLYRMRTLVAPAESLATLPLDEERGQLPLVAANAVRAVARADQRPMVEFEPPAAPAGAIVRGQPFGTATVTLDGREVAEVEVVAGRTVAAASSPGAPAGAIAVAGVVLAAVAFGMWRAVRTGRLPRR